MNRREFFTALSAVAVVAALPKQVKALATGGEIPTGVSYLVGEVGPELFAPLHDGWNFMVTGWHAYMKGSGKIESQIALRALSTQKDVTADLSIVDTDVEWLRATRQKYLKQKSVYLYWPKETPSIIPPPRLDGEVISRIVISEHHPIVRLTDLRGVTHARYR